MELNTNERRINQEVLDILRGKTPEPAFKGTILEGRERRYTVIKELDLDKYVMPFFQKVLGWVCEDIERGRENDGKKPFNSYVVINVDEPYINDIIAVLEANGHWDGKPADANNTLNRYKTALEIILDEGAQECEGYETTIVKTAREALGISEKEYWK